LRQWGEYGSGNGQFNQINSIAVDSSGNVYVSDLGNHRIQKFTSSGLYLTQWQASGSIAIDSSGIVYIGELQSDGQYIVKFTSDGVFFIEVWKAFLDI
jgi:DNA-binding beta-propeller fold protein YncE